MNKMPGNKMDTEKLIKLLNEFNVEYVIFPASGSVSSFHRNSTYVVFTVISCSG